MTQSRDYRAEILAAMKSEDVAALGMLATELLAQAELVTARRARDVERKHAQREARAAKQAARSAASNEASNPPSAIAEAFGTDEHVRGNPRMSAEIHAVPRKSEDISPAPLPPSLLPPRPPNNSYPQHPTPSRSPRASAREREDGGSRHGNGNGKRDAKAEAAHEKLRQAAGARWEEIRDFGLTVPEELRAGWLREMAGMIQPGGQYPVEALLSAIGDATAVGGYTGLRAGLQGLRSFVERAARRLTSIGTGKVNPDDADAVLAQINARDEAEAAGHQTPAAPSAAMGGRRG